MRIGSKLIGVSTLLVVLVVGVFAALNSTQSRRLIDDATDRLRDRITSGLQQAGAAQLALLSATSRIALLQNDYTTLQTIVQDTAKQDERLTAVVVIDKSGTLVASNDQSSVGKRLPEPLRQAVAGDVKAKTAMTAQKTMVLASPVQQDGVTLATVALAYSLRPLYAELDKAEKLKKTEVARSLRNTFIVGVVSVMVGILLAILQGLGISRPIGAVVRRVNEMASGNLHARVDVKSHDEIGWLGDRFNHMADQMLTLLRETSKRAAMEKELEVASAVQSTLVPNANVMTFQHLALAGFFRPATQCGGDWWTYEALSRDRVLIIIGDVTGHGVASAMITATAKGATTTYLQMTKGEVELAELLAAMNAGIRAAGKGHLVMSCFACVYDPASRELSYANAGHNFPYHCSASATDVTQLVARGNRLGDKEASDYPVRRLRVEPGDSIIFYTDGIVECEDVRGTEFGERRFRALVKRNAPLDAAKMRDELVDRAFAFYGSMPQKDDITLVVGRFS